MAAHPFDRRVAETQISKSYVFPRAPDLHFEGCTFDKMGISLKTLEENTVILLSEWQLVWDRKLEDARRLQRLTVFV
jgi:hypothetical protein